MIVSPQQHAPQEALSNVLPFKQRNRNEPGHAPGSPRYAEDFCSIAGGFWARPLSLQHERIRELFRARLSIEQIAELVRLPADTVRNIVKERS